MKQTKEHSSRLYLFSFLLPAAIMLASYAMLGVYPFGKKTLFTIDMANEYVQYFSALKEMLMGNGSVFYSFGKLLGGNMVGLYAYYLASPLNIIFLFFSNADFDLAVLILTLLKIGLSGLTFSLYLHRTRGGNPALIVVFAAFYGLMAYNVAYQLNIMWLDGVICLPLVVWGIELLVDKRKPLLYAAFLLISILTNYYIGFMICLFSFLYFIYRLLLSQEYKASVTRAKYFRARLGSFLMTSVLSAGSGGFLLLPVAFSLSTGRKYFTIYSLAPFFDYPFFSVLSKVALGAGSYGDEVKGLPLIYCGLLTSVLVLLFFFNRLIAKREKFYSAAFLGFLLLCFSFNTLNRIWHGLNPPCWFPYRYSFVFSFLILVLAYRSASLIRGVRLRHILSACGLLLILFAFLKGEDFTDLSAAKLAASAVFTAGYGMLLIAWLRNRSASGRRLLIMFLPVICAELIFNSYGMLSGLHYTERSVYRNYVLSTSAAVDRVKPKKNTFYRIEKTFTCPNSVGNPTFNDSFLFGYDGLAHYSSSDDRNVNQLMGLMGYKNNNNWAYFDRGSTLAANSVFGVRYILSKGNPGGGYDEIGRSGEIGIYENPYSLPIAFMTDRHVSSLNGLSAEPFTFQNQLLNAMSRGAKRSYFQSLRYSIKLQNLRAVQRKNGLWYYRINQNKPASLSFTVVSNGKGPLYGYIPSNANRQVKMILNGRNIGTAFDGYNGGVIPLGTFKSGEPANLTLSLTGSDMSFKSSEFYILDMDAFQKLYRQLVPGEMNVTSLRDTSITGTVDSNGQMLFTSIPYDKGWSVKIDGRQIRQVKLLGTLMGINVPKGVHRIEFDYLPEGLSGGLILSIISLAGAAIYFWALYSRNGSL